MKFGVLALPPPPFPLPLCLEFIRVVYFLQGGEPKQQPWWTEALNLSQLRAAIRHASQWDLQGPEQRSRHQGYLGRLLDLIDNFEVAVQFEEQQLMVKQQEEALLVEKQQLVEQRRRLSQTPFGQALLAVSGDSITSTTDCHQKSPPEVEKEWDDDDDNEEEEEKEKENNEGLPTRKRTSRSSRSAQEKKKKQKKHKHQDAASEGSSFSLTVPSRSPSPSPAPASSSLVVRTPVVVVVATRRAPTRRILFRTPANNKSSPEERYTLENYFMWPSSLRKIFQALGGPIKRGGRVTYTEEEAHDREQIRIRAIARWKAERGGEERSK